jgi:hypothetical protein
MSKQHKGARGGTIDTGFVFVICLHSTSCFKFFNLVLAPAPDRGIQTGILFCSVPLASILFVVVARAAPLSLCYLLRHRHEALNWLFDTHCDWLRVRVFPCLTVHSLFMFAFS